MVWLVLGLVLAAVVLVAAFKVGEKYGRDDEASFWAGPEAEVELRVALDDLVWALEECESLATTDMALEKARQVLGLPRRRERTEA